MTLWNNNEFERLFELVTFQLEGELSDRDRLELANTLKSSDEAKNDYVELMQDATSLRWWCSNAPFEGLSGEASHRSLPLTKWTLGRPMAITALAASLLILFVLGSITYWEVTQLVRSRPSQQQALQESAVGGSLVENRADKLIPSDVATLTRLQEVGWAPNSTPMGEMSRLRVGQILWLERGDAEIIFDRAVQLVVRGPACLEIRSPSEVYSPYGRISARVGKTGIGFAIQTPRGRIVDLGTEFGVAINEYGATDVAVFRGAVAFDYKNSERDPRSGVNRRLVQGQAIHLGVDGKPRRLIAIDDSTFPPFTGRFPRSVSKSSEIFLDVHDNVRDETESKFYRIVPGGFHEDALAYVDRQHEWNGIDESGLPKELIGADYVMPFNEDKLMPTLEVTLKIGRPASLYILLSDIARVPKWLKEDFVKTDMKVGLDESGEYTSGSYAKPHYGSPMRQNPRFHLAAGPGQEIDTVFSVWKRDVKTPNTTITLGSVRQGKRGWGFCMYGIAAMPLEIEASHDSN